VTACLPACSFIPPNFWRDRWKVCTERLRSRHAEFSCAVMMQKDIHTSAQAFGKVMSTLKPRHAVALLQRG